MAAAASPADNYVCDYEPSPSYLELFQAYYNLTIELSTACSIITSLWTIHVLFLEPNCIFLLHYTISWNYEPYTLSSRLLHLSHIALYLFKMISHIFFEERKPHDHLMLIIHHIVTIMLIAFSYINQSNGLGMTVMFLHLSTDIFLYLGRFLTTLLPALSKHGIKIDPTISILVHVDIVAFLVFWIVNRLYLFPLRTIWPMIKQQDSYRVFAPIASSYLSAILSVLNVLWTWFLIRYLTKSMKRRDLIVDPMKQKDF